MNIIFVTLNDLRDAQELYTELFDFLVDPSRVIFFQPENVDNPLWRLVDKEKTHPERLCCPKEGLLNVVGAKATELIAGKEEVPRMTLVALVDLVTPCDVFTVLNPIFGASNVGYEKISKTKASYRFFKKTAKTYGSSGGGPFGGHRQQDSFLRPWTL